MEFIQTHKTFIYSLLFIVFFSVSVSYATTPSFHTLDPQCAPTDPSCVVSPIVDSSEILYDPISRTLSVNPSATYISFIDTTTQSFSGNKTFLGNISGINGVAYSFPGTQGTANSLLINDGNGNLTWTPQTSLALWSTSGNTGTTPGTNFIGTTDAQDLVFKTNGVEHIRITSGGGLVLQQVVTANYSRVMMYDYRSTITNPAGGTNVGTGKNSFIHGIASSANSSIIASGDNSLVIGTAATGTGHPAAILTASGAGSQILAYDLYGIGTASGKGSFLSAYFASDTSTAIVSGDGAYAQLGLQTGGNAQALAPGSFISGVSMTQISGLYALLQTTSGANGSAILGGAEIGGMMQVNGMGSLAEGFTGTYGVVKAGSATAVTKGSMAFGYGHFGSLVNDSSGSFVGGARTSSSTYNNGVGSFTWGTGTSSGTTSTPADYSFLFGYAISNTTPRTMSVGWSAIKLFVSDSGVLANTFLKAGSSSITTGTSVAQFQNAGGTCTVIPSTSGGITCTSDITLKKNITTLDSNSTYTLTSINTPTSATTLDKIMSLSPVVYNWNIESDTDQKHTGFIAQEVAQVFPDLVTTDQATNIKSLSYTGFVPYLTKAVQELNVKITDIQHLQGETRNSLFSVLQDWFASAQNGIATIFADKVQTKQLCISDTNGKTCVDKDTLIAIFSQVQKN